MQTHNDIDILGIDASTHLLLRCWSAVEGQDGERFAEGLLAVVRQRAIEQGVEPGQVIVCMDSPIPGQRAALRQEGQPRYALLPAPVRRALPLAAEVLVDAGIEVVERAGLESIDLLAHLVLMAWRDRQRIALVSSDRRLHTLAGFSDRLKLLPVERPDQPIVWEALVREYRVPLERLGELFALQGGRYGIKGLPGVGPARAAQIIRHLRSLYELPAVLDLLPAAAREALDDYLPRLPEALYLATPDPWAVTSPARRALAEITGLGLAA